MAIAILLTGVWWLDHANDNYYFYAHEHFTSLLFGFFHFAGARPACGGAGVG